MAENYRGETYEALLVMKEEREKGIEKLQNDLIEKRNRIGKLLAEQEFLDTKQGSLGMTDPELRRKEELRKEKASLEEEYLQKKRDTDKKIPLLNIEIDIIYELIAKYK